MPTTSPTSPPLNAEAHLLSPVEMHINSLRAEREDSIDSGYAEASWTGPTPLALSPPANRGRYSAQRHASVSFSFESPTSLSTSPGKFYARTFPKGPEAVLWTSQAPIAEPKRSDSEDPAAIALPLSPDGSVFTYTSPASVAIPESPETGSQWRSPSALSYMLSPNTSLDLSDAVEEEVVAAVKRTSTTLFLEKEDASFQEDELTGESSLGDALRSLQGSAKHFLAKEPLPFRKDEFPWESSLGDAPRSARTSSKHFFEKESPPSKEGELAGVSSLGDALRSLHSVVSEYGDEADHSFTALPPLPPSAATSPNSSNSQQSSPRTIAGLSSAKRKWNAVVGELSTLSLEMNPFPQTASSETPLVPMRLLSMSPEAVRAATPKDTSYERYLASDDSISSVLEADMTIEAAGSPTALSSTGSSPSSVPSQTLSPPHAFVVGGSPSASLLPPGSSSSPARSQTPSPPSAPVTSGSPPTALSSPSLSPSSARSQTLSPPSALVVSGPSTSLPSPGSSSSSVRSQTLSPPSAYVVSGSPSTALASPGSSSSSARSQTLSPPSAPVASGSRIFTPPPPRGRTDTIRASTYNHAATRSTSSPAGQLASPFSLQTTGKDKGKARETPAAAFDWDGVMDAGNVSTKAPFGFRYPYSLARGHASSPSVNLRKITLDMPGLSADISDLRRQSYLSASSESVGRSASASSSASLRSTSPISPVTSINSNGLRPLRLSTAISPRSSSSFSRNSSHHGK
ncbi:hypothetical protein FIBSPDRAFT_254530 [Athelia psychrophila]|uniref:Uncharacterized protein n=1 Tax=Athelia psychrophila TaxID=1759441 RepID=A0A165XNA4_9AGAM|nr:hypothetical protein FIBSPDRAFT_254530 [Fibularhizoctonia sp. CBS 109695]